jgi:signal transduction histidine kinase
LTLIQGGLFLVAGVALLAVTHLLFTWQLERGSRVVARTDGDSRVFAVSGADAVPADSELQRWMRDQQADLQAAATTSLLAQGTIALGVVGTGAAGCAWLASGRVLRPLRRVTETARRIAASPGTHHGLRVGLRGPVDEVKELADAFDSMVERLDRSLDGQRRFVANASHELRTPSPSGGRSWSWPCAGPRPPTRSARSAPGSWPSTTGTSA